MNYYKFFPLETPNIGFFKTSSVKELVTGSQVILNLEEEEIIFTVNITAEGMIEATEGNGNRWSIIKTSEQKTGGQQFFVTIKDAWADEASLEESDVLQTPFSLKERILEEFNMRINRGGPYVSQIIVDAAMEDLKQVLDDLKIK